MSKYILVGKNNLTEKEKELMRELGYDPYKDMVEWIQMVDDVNKIFEIAEEKEVETIVITSLPDWMVAAITVIAGKRRKHKKQTGTQVLYFRQKIIGVYDTEEKARQIKEEEQADVMFESNGDYVVMKTVGIDRLVKAKIISHRVI